MKSSDIWSAFVILIFSVACLVTIFVGASNHKIVKEDVGTSSSEVNEATTIDDNLYEFTYEWEKEFYEQVSAQVDVVPDFVCIGEFKLTVYTPESDGGKWGYKTATCEKSQHLMTCAVDPDVIPYGTTIIIGGENGLRLKAVDCGSSVHGNHIDIFFDGTETSASIWLSEQFGDSADVYIERW